MTQVSTSDIRGPYALDNDAPTARQTLDCLSAILDDDSMFHLDEAMNRPVTDRRCLELGAGNGSIAAWLAHMVADAGGEVVAVDIKPQHIRPAPGVRVLGLDVAGDELPAGPWDVIHARLLLAHVPQRRDILNRLVHLLAPGGALVIEEWGGEGPARVLSDPGGHTAALFERYTEALLAVFAAQGNDPTWCTAVPAVMVDAGLCGVSMATHARSWRGGTAGCDLPVAVSTELHDRLIAHGMSAGDLDELRTRLADPDTLLIGNRTWSTTGRNPA